MALRFATRRAAAKVPEVFVQFGLEQQFRFISHPGVMAVSKLLEMGNVCRMRATFTQENIEKMKAFDPELARKAQIAFDNKLPINFQQLEIIEDSLPRLLEEKKQLETARQAIAKLPVGGPYELPKSLDISAARPVPGQKDIQGTRLELAEIRDPGCLEKLVEGPQKAILAKGAVTAKQLK
mmetsp:Transcript_78766/g.172760  ORF Transcript_78766/g.172760 Transcript_78766/m.172760 type:complete len:181 (+) Transcript_78766:98-640(+)